MPTSIEFLQGDITQVAADAIVNAANSQLEAGSGVCGAILKAGGPSIFEECRKIGGCPPGSAVATGVISPWTNSMDVGIVHRVDGQKSLDLPSQASISRFWRSVGDSARLTLHVVR